MEFRVEARRPRRESRLVPYALERDGNDDRFVLSFCRFVVVLFCRFVLSFCLFCRFVFVAGLAGTVGRSGRQKNFAPHQPYVDPRIELHLGSCLLFT